MTFFSRETLENHKAAIACSVLAGGIAFLAALPLAMSTVESAGSNIARIVNKPDKVDLAVDSYIESINEVVNWTDPPTIQQGSVDYFKSHFSSLNPFVPHHFDPARGVASATLSIDEVARRLPEFEGEPVTVEGRLTNVPTQVTKYPNATAWAFFLGDTMRPVNLVVCRAPLPILGESESPDFVTGDTMIADGVLLADGGIQIARPGGTARAIYMACAAVARRPVPEDGEFYRSSRESE
ncbi:MAG: hypothetical protein ACPGYP_07670 [Solirubrobacterales bacterium]